MTRASDFFKVPGGLDSDAVSGIIATDVNKTFVDALNVDADTLDNQNGTYYLDYNNFTNTPSIPSAANNATITLSAGAGLTGGGDFTTDQAGNETITFNATYDSASTIGIIDSDYIAARIPTVSSDFVSIDSTSTVSSQFALDTFSLGEYNATEYTLVTKRNNVAYSSKLLMVADSSSASVTEYAQLGTSHGIFDADINSGNGRLLFTPDSAETTIIRLKALRI
jgi:hypothetical protein